MPVALTHSTAEKLKELMSANNGLRQGVAKGGGVRQLIHVEVTSEANSAGFYPCLPMAYQPELGVWEAYEDAFVFEANDEALKVGNKYLAINYGNLEGFAIFATDIGLPELECHLEYKTNEDGKKRLSVIVDTLVGDGLEVSSDSGSSDCDKIKVKEGCGIKVDSDGVRVDTEIDEEKEFIINSIESVSAAGCSFTIAYVPIKIKRNACGVFVDYERKGVEFISGTLDCGDLPPPDDDSSSSDGCCFTDGWYCVDGECVFISQGDCCDSDSSSSDCAGWYCCQETGTVVYLANCEEVEAYQCGDSSTPCEWSGPGWYCALEQIAGEPPDDGGSYVCIPDGSCGSVRWIWQTDIPSGTSLWLPDGGEGCGEGCYNGGPPDHNGTYENQQEYTVCCKYWRYTCAYFADCESYHASPLAVITGPFETEGGCLSECNATTQNV